MGVHGLSGLVSRARLDHHNATASSPTIPQPGGASTLAIDGNGLAFHLVRMAYRRHRHAILSTPAYQRQQCTALRAQLLLPSLTPLSLLHEVTTSYLRELTTTHRMRVKIYFDGPDQKMKWRERQSRREQRGEEWENVQRLCQRGILPAGENSAPLKFRSAARKQRRDHARRSSGLDLDDQDDDADAADAERYLASFPLSPLAMEKVQRSIVAYAELAALLLPPGTVEVLQCEGEADVEVAKASAVDSSGRTYALAKDSDYLVYGYSDEAGGEARYIQFEQIDPSTEALFAGTVLTRSDVATAIGLPAPSAMIELSILLGNDYTSPFVKEENLKKRQYFWNSIRWHREGEVQTESLPPQGELSFFDVEGIVEHVAEKTAEGWKLTSDMDELRMAIHFSYLLYSFGDISGFPSTAPRPAEEGESTDEEGDSDGDIDIGGTAVAFPSLPPELDLGLARNAPATMDLCEAALLPLAKCIPGAAPEIGLDYVEQRHIDAFRMTLQGMTTGNKQELEPPRRKLQWMDVQSLYILERCLLEAIRGCVESLSNMPCMVFDHSYFHSCLESLSFEDFPLDNELVSQHAKDFLEEATSAFPNAKDDDEEEGTKPLVLPIDAHKENILHTVKTQRVTIIHGETGCGKSSRVPCFLLRADPPQPTRAAPEVKMIISQPRRIAAKALAERVRSCEPDLADKIGLRMGHGIREYETSKTRAWFVTTGYVVRLLANHPSWFDSHTHLIIDEVHERSVDTDILCLLCRRLLQSHPTIRLVLMSATMAAELYNQYFGVPQPPIHVGARRFPIREYFVEDLSSQLSLSAKSAKTALDVYNDCEKNCCSSAPSASNMEKLYNLATQIASSVGDTGSSVLIFVPGMADIEAISERIESLTVPGVTFVCLPIHSDVPFEEQMAAFEPPKEGEIKVIIATNAAESSLTLPDVDHVVCLGLCKQIVYDQSSHRQMLVPTWISRASATQRAGRTGRVREGNVYRLYSRNAFYSYMPPFEAGEMVRIPLDSVILSLRDMLNEEVTPILLDCLEPPDISAIDRSFLSLHASNFISDPTDKGEITSLGSLVVALGIDLTLGAFVGLGIQFGVAAEAIQLAAILSFPKTPWAISSPMYHDTDTFNEIVTKTFASRCYFDAGLFSEPMGTSSLLYAYRNSRDRNQFCWRHRVSGSRMKHLYGTVQSLTRRVATCLNVSAEVLEIEEPLNLMPPAKLSILRILQVWLFHDTMITMPKSKVECAGGRVTIELDGPPIGDDHLAHILDAKRHPFEIHNRGKIVQQGRFDPDVISDKDQYLEGFEIRFASYQLETKVGFSFYFVGTSLKIFIPSNIWDAQENSKLRDGIIGKFSVHIKELTYLQNSGSGNQRGRRGRAAGAWHPLVIGSAVLDVIEENNDGSDRLKQLFILSTKLTKPQIKEFKKHVEAEISNRFDSIKSILSCSIDVTKKKVLFNMTSSGECHQVSDVDLRDLFAAPDLVASVSTSTSRQSVAFPPPADNETVEDGSSTNSRPLIEDAPEGARLMSVLASERRRDHFIRFSDPDQEFIDVNLPKTLSINGNKWKRKGSGNMVFVPENCVPMAVIPTDSNLELFACCANTLELRGGACRVEGITMLPAGRMFVGLSLLSFGVNPLTGNPIDLLAIDEFSVEEKKETGEMNPIVRDALSWIYDKENLPWDQQEQWRVEEAIAFHASCLSLGETLTCQPDKVRALCALFDEVGGRAMALWEGYDLSLTTAMASLRSKSAKKDAKDKDRSHDGRNDNDEQSTPKKKAPTIVPQSAIANAKAASKQSFACVGCSKLFKKWKACRTHRETCCPDKECSRKEAIALANGLESSVMQRVPSSNDEAKENRLDQPKPSNQPKPTAEADEEAGMISNEKSLKMVWECQGCNERFFDRKKCSEHMETCCFGIVSNARPRAYHHCLACTKSFRSGKQYASHTKKCKAASSGAELTQERPKPCSTAVLCEVCNMSCLNTASYQQHINGKKHKRRVDALGAGSIATGTEQQSDNKDTPRPVFCKVCGVSCPNIFSYDQHLKGEKHKRRAKHMAANDGDSVTEAPITATNVDGSAQDITTTAAAAAARARARAAAENK